MLLSWELYEIQAEGITAEAILNNVVEKNLNPLAMDGFS